MNVLVTGGTGAVGSELIRGLFERGDDVKVLVRPATLADAGRMRHILRRGAITLVPGDVCDPSALQRAVRDVEAVYHLAASLPPASAAELTSTNVGATQSLLRTCLEQGVRRIVFTSSAAVYGYRQARSRWPIDEDAPLEGSDDYARSKVAAERRVRLAARAADLDCVIVRPSAVLSADAPYLTGLVKNVARRPYRTTIATRSWTIHPIDVQDLVRGLIAAGTFPGALRRTINLAGPEHVPVSALIGVVARTLHQASVPIPSTAATELSELKYDTRRARELLDFHPELPAARAAAEAARRYVSVSNGYTAGRRRFGNRWSQPRWRMLGDDW